jgi:Tfp pilus assembly protein PilN
MLRINLLPPYVTQRRLTKRLVPVFLGLFLLSIVLPLLAYFNLNTKLKDLTDQANAAVAGKAITDGLKAQAATTLAQVDPIKAKLQFVTDVNAYTRKWVALYNTLADTTPKSSFIYTAAQVTGPTMAIKAYSPSVEEVGRYLQVMYHEPDFSSVVVDKIPSYPDNIRHLYYLNGVMVFADGATASAAGAAEGGFSGDPSGAGGQVAGGVPANWTPDAIGPNGPTNIPAGVGPPPAEIAVGGTAASGAASPQGGFGGGQGAGQNGASTSYSPNFLRVAGRLINPFASPEIRDQLLHDALHHVVVKEVSKGFDINVTATLKEPLTPPGLPGTAPAGGAAPGGFPGGTGGGEAPAPGEAPPTSEYPPGAAPPPSSGGGPPHGGPPSR